jgi:hypothetical protein
MKIYNVLVAFILAILVFGYFARACFAVSPTDAGGALRNAEENLALAYVYVAEAERAGANISELLARLVYAGGLLAEAKNSYGAGDYERAYSLAINCSSAVNNVASEASDLKLKAEEAYGERLLFTVGISSAGLSVLFVLSLFVWRSLRKWYVGRVLKMKPIVEDKA